MKIETHIHIQSTPEKVWNVLMDFETYPQWNPFIKSVKGKIQLGQRITVDLQGMTFKPKIIKYHKNRSFSWLGQLVFKGIFDGQHSFDIVENKNGGTDFIHSEKFSGLLVPLLRSKLLNETLPAFELMNKKLKERVEAMSI
ncbi:SRPBCC domain-containing protein [Echinicola sp. 20G]|uniref:SRPBCC domain-containing protein n=1 Tax=Echinicola sp. 20G TaxID=2781961 RepID=UPI00190FE63B|nr:SRPBCC domain-containing protein [Echinicola sp. 20G]